MKILALSALVILPLCGCTLTPEQEAWNRQHHVDEIPLLPAGSATPSSYDADQQKQREIKQGEDVENEEARKAGFGPSPTEGMNCTTTGSSTGSANSGTSSSTTTCHN